MGDPLPYSGLRCTVITTTHVIVYGERPLACVDLVASVVLVYVG